MKFDPRPPGGMVTWVALVWIVIGAFLAVVGLVGALDAFRATLGSVMFVLGLGIWLRQPWARWTGVAISSLMLALGGWAAFRDGLAWETARRLFLPIWYLWALLEWDVRDKKTRSDCAKESTDDCGSGHRPMISLVQLLREPRYLDAAILAHLASRAWGQTVTTDEPDSKTFVVGDSPHLMAQCDGLFFAIHNIDRPYWDQPAEAAEDMRELRFQKALLEHRAWLSVDVLNEAETEAAVERAYGYIAKLQAELVDDNTLAIMCPGMSWGVPADPGLEDKLRGPEPLHDVQHPELLPVFSVPPDNASVAAAVAEARRRWPEFVRAFESEADKEKFFIKAPISDGANTEYMWLAVERIDGEMVYGRLDNEPVNIADLKPGDKLRVPAPDLSDWLYTNEGSNVGGFSIGAVRDSLRGELVHDCLQSGLFMYWRRFCGGFRGLWFRVVCEMCRGICIRNGRLSAERHMFANLWRGSAETDNRLSDL